MSELYLVRHAQASFDAEHYDELSATGIEQSRLLGAFFAEQGIQFEGMVTGAMRRHKQTLDALGEAAIADGCESAVHAGLNEYDFRTLVRVYCEAHPADELVVKVNEDLENRKAYFRLLRAVLTAWSEDMLEDTPESWRSFCQRVADARASLHAMTATCGRILVVSSGGAISTFTGSVLDLSPKHIFDLNLQLMNTSITRFFLDSTTISLAAFNTLPHLVAPAQSSYRTYS